MRRKRRQEGAVLVLAVIVLMVLFVVVTQFAYTTGVETRLAENSEESLKIYYAARAIMEAAQALLAEDDTPMYDAETDMWGEKYEHRFMLGMYARSLGDVNCQFAIRDSARYVNLAGLWSKNKAIRTDSLKLLDKLCQVLRIEGDLGINELHLRIQDFLDNDAGGTYEFEGNINRNMLAMEELMDLPDVQLEALEKAYFGYHKEFMDYGENDTKMPGLIDCLTIWGDNTARPPRININTASKEVLAAVIMMAKDDLSVETALEEAATIIERRDEDEETDDDSTDKAFFNKFGSINKDLKEIECEAAADSSRWFTIIAGATGKPQFFIIGLSAAEAKVKKEIRIVMSRKVKGRGWEFTFHMWRELPPYVPLKKKEGWDF